MGYVSIAEDVLRNKHKYFNEYLNSKKITGNNAQWHNQVWDEDAFEQFKLDKLKVVEVEKALTNINDTDFLNKLALLTSRLNELTFDDVKTKDIAIKITNQINNIIKNNPKVEREKESKKQIGNDYISKKTWVIKNNIIPALKSNLNTVETDAAKKDINDAIAWLNNQIPKFEAAGENAAKKWYESTLIPYIENLNNKHLRRGSNV